MKHVLEMRAALSLPPSDLAFYTQHLNLSKQILLTPQFKELHQCKTWSNCGENSSHQHILLADAGERENVSFVMKMGYYMNI